MSKLVLTSKLGFSGLLISLIVLSSQMGYANLYYYYANNYLQRWLTDSTGSSESSYNAALSAIKLSNRMHPDNPQYLITLGSIQEQGAYDEHTDDSNFHLALTSYNNSIHRRPLWPMTWISKVMTKWELGEIDDEMWDSLIMLEKTGPYTKEVNIAIVDVGLMLMSENTEYSEQAEQLVAEHYRRGMANSRAVKQLEDIIADYEVEEIAANWLN
ncbi:MAG: hypothetical protein GY808_04435 [Gammaproteobacteria bacterium]|nr:hypothetical protein [Gammaproteobacteria bacterium]